MDGLRAELVRDSRARSRHTGELCRADALAMI